MEVGPRVQGSRVPEVGARLGDLHPPTTPCSLSLRPPRDSGYQVRDALQSFPVYVVFLRLFLSFPVFKVSFPPAGVALTWCSPDSFGHPLGLGLF